MENKELLIPTKIVFCKRKSLALVINAKGELIVRAPIKYSQKRINDFINEKSSWIISKRQAIINSYAELNIVDGTKLSLLGDEYNIVLTDSKFSKIKDNIIYLNNKEPKQCLKRLLIRLAKTYFAKRVAELSQIINLKYASISITSAKTRWGSCGGKNTLNFCFRLLFCPRPVVDYVIIHELCHTKQKNHQAKFWQLVKNFCPEYKLCLKWLKDNRNIMELI